MQGELRVRRCEDGTDAEAIHGLVRELAEYERMLHGVKLSVSDIRRDGFELKSPLFFATLAEIRDSDTWVPVGVLLGYYKYSTW